MQGAHDWDFKTKKTEKNCNQHLICSYCILECLANGDCPLAEYCDLPTETCKNACSLNGK